MTRTGLLGVLGGGLLGILGGVLGGVSMTTELLFIPTLNTYFYCLSQTR